MTEVPMPSNKERSAITRAKSYVLEDQIGHILRRAHQRATSIFVRNFTVHQLTPTQFATLAKIADEEQVSQNRLGRLTAMDPATMKGVIGRLHHRGLIQRSHDPDDRRRTLWRLTAAGEALFAASIAAGKRTTAETLAPLSEAERAVLLDLLRRLG
jgi:DNA-binding MarR family transcriptional regulator